MGYLNYNLEKVASYVMEKQALSVADLVRMGKDAVSKDKALHFIKRLNQRNRALANNEQLRVDKLQDAVNKLGDAATLELRYGKSGSSSNEIGRLRHRLIRDSSGIVDALMQIGPKTVTKKGPIRELLGVPCGKPQLATALLLDSQHVPITSNQLAKIVDNLKRSWGDELRYTVDTLHKGI
jgi:hypothetical protein